MCEENITTSDVKLIIDNREHNLYDKLLSLISENMSKETLDIGDIMFKNNEEILLVIERKTIQDLKASICDGRHREQKFRLINTLPRNRIMYLIEGNMNTDKIQGMPMTTLIGSLINTQFRDSIKVYKTSCLNESAIFIQKLYDKISKEKFFADDEPTGLSNKDYSSTLKKKKKANMTHDVWFLSQLSNIPQVSENIAAEVLKVYPTLISLSTAYEKIPIDLRPLLLSTIPITLKTGKSRKLGLKISSRIYEFFYGITSVVSETDDQ